MDSQKNFAKKKNNGSNNLIEQIQQFDDKTQQGINRLILYITKLEPSLESFKKIKKLIIKFGLAILIHLKPYYEKLREQDKENIQNLKILAGIANEVINNKKIKEIDFIFKYGIIPYKKQVDKYPNQIHFIGIIEQLSKINQEFLTKAKIDISVKQKYNQNINKLYQRLLQKNTDKNNHIQEQQLSQPTLLMIKSFQSFRLSQNSFSKNLLKWVQDTDQQSWESQKPEQDMFSFYDHHTNTIMGCQTQKSNFNYSINSNSSSNSMILEQTKLLCCRKYFIEDQLLNNQEDLRTTFLQIKYPFSQHQIQPIKRVMCSMLNCQGGKIYIGITKAQKGKKQIKGNIYTDNQKQQIYKYFRRIAEKIQPQIITQKLYSVQFVPICRKTKQFIPGANVIRITVNYGVRDQIYSYEKDGFDYFPFRNDFQIIQKQGRQLLKAHKNIILKPLPIPAPYHPQPCQKPETGQPLNLKTSTNVTPKQTKKRFQQLPNINKLNATESTMPNQYMQQSRHAYSLTQKPTLRGKMSAADSHQPSSHKQYIHYTHFYVVGLDEKHLTPIFIEKNINHNIKIQSTKDHKVVVRVHGTTQTQKTRKVLRKIQVKYEKKNIKVYQMTRQIQVDINLLEQAIKLIKNIKLPYKIYDSYRIRFKLIRESFQAFLQLESHKIPVTFFLNDQ